MRTNYANNQVTQPLNTGAGVQNQGPHSEGYGPTHLAPTGGAGGGRGGFLSGGNSTGTHQIIQYNHPLIHLPNEGNFNQEPPIPPKKLV